MRAGLAPKAAAEPVEDSGRNEIPRGVPDQVKTWPVHFFRLVIFHAQLTLGVSSVPGKCQAPCFAEELSFSIKTPNALHSQGA